MVVILSSSFSWLLRGPLTFEGHNRIEPQNVPFRLHFLVYCRLPFPLSVPTPVDESRGSYFCVFGGLVPAVSWFPSLSADEAQTPFLSLRPSLAAHQVSSPLRLAATICDPCLLPPLVIRQSLKLGVALALASKVTNQILPLLPLKSLSFCSLTLDGRLTLLSAVLFHWFYRLPLLCLPTG